MNILFRLCINKLSAGKWLQKIITINCVVLKRQLVVLEVVIIFSSPRKKLLKYDQFMVAFTGKRKTRLALYFNQFQEKRHCNRNTVLQSGFTPKKRSLLALCSEKETVSNSKVFQFQSLNVRRWTQPPPRWPQLDYVLRDIVPVFFETIQSSHHIVRKSLTPRK